MNAIGIRATPKAVTFVILNCSKKDVLNVDHIRIPLAFATPDALKFLRNNLLDVLREYKVTFAGIKATEPNAKQANIARIQIEGVIQEAFASSMLQSYYVGQISSISARINIPREDFKKYVSGEKDWAVDDWDKFSDVEREAFLCAVGACNA